MSIFEMLINFLNYTENPLTTVISSLLLIYSGYKVSSFFYNYYIHPLSKIPGPKHLLLTSIYKTYHHAKGSLPNKINEWHIKYGPVIRLGPSEISVIDHSGSKLIYTNSKFQKSKFTKGLERIFGLNLFTIIDRDEHSKRRRIVSHAFSQRNLDEMQPIIWNNGVNELLKKLEDKSDSGELVNFIEEFHYLTVDIIGELAFGQRFNMIKNGEHDLMNHIKNSTVMMVFYLTFPILQYIRVPFMSKFYNAIEYKNEFAKKAVQLKKESSLNTRDIMHYYLEAKDSDTGEKLTDKQLEDEAIILLFAGVDSTASTMSMCIYYLLKYPEIYNNLVEELDRVSSINENGNIKPYNWLKENLPYLQGVILETLRLSPAFPFGIPRLVPEGGVNFSDNYLPANTEVSVSIYSYQRNPNYFPNPTEFQPERWIKKTDASLQDSILAFAKGSRVCIGKHLALMEITLSLIGLLTKFKLVALGEEDKIKGDDEIINFVHFKPKSGRVSCRLIKRETSNTTALTL